MDWALSIVLGRFFSIRPKVAKRNGALVATSSWKSLLLTLGSWSRRVVIDPYQKTIRIRARYFWFFVRTRRIQFDWVQDVLYGYNEVSDGWLDAHQQGDCFSVALRLRNGQVVTLFRFYGEGEFVNHGVFPDWFYWGDMLEAKLTQGPQEGESLAYADVVSQLLGVPLGNPEP